MRQMLVSPSNRKQKDAVEGIPFDHCFKPRLGPFARSGGHHNQSNSSEWKIMALYRCTLYYMSLDQILAADVHLCGPQTWSLY
jgi:hypothetical protein